MTAPKPAHDCQIIEVEFKPAPPSAGDVDPLLSVKSIWATSGSCRHETGAFVVDEKLRQVSCRSCGQTLDPVQCLLELARKWDLYSTNRWAIKGEVARLSKLREELRREVANLKACIRRAKDAAAKAFTGPRVEP